MTPSSSSSPSATPKQRPEELSFRTMVDADFKQDEGDEIATSSLKDPVSIVVTDSRRPEGREIVAFQGNKIIDRHYMEKLTRKPPSTCPVDAILDHMVVAWNAQTSIFKNNPNAKVMYYLAVAVEEEYEGMGLAKELLDRSMTIAKEQGCDAIVVLATAFATQHLFANRLGFDRIVQLRYEDFEMWTDSIEGERKFPFLGLAQPEFIEAYETMVKV
ncbi:hypothetical protein DFQ26_005986 [Actinomortierella ambigua]|nr:hypothetical protein DFQ26_005986 [Actinomortierella ambigua]